MTDLQFTVLWAVFFLAGVCLLVWALVRPQDKPKGGDVIHTNRTGTDEPVPPIAWVSPVVIPLDQEIEIHLTRGGEVKARMRVGAVAHIESATRPDVLVVTEKTLPPPLGGSDG